MGPKGKPKTPKGKQPIKPVPEENPLENVTEVQKEFFLFTLSDIEKKLNRIDGREEELKAETIEIEEKIEEFKKEKGAVITEHEQLLILKEEEKVQKREEMCQLSDEIKVRTENHKKHIQELEENFKHMVIEYTEQIEVQEEEIRILEDHKQNKDIYGGQLDELEMQINEAEMQHQRNLFEISHKWEMAKVRVKKELQSRLLHLSIDFRNTSQKKIGKPCHRATLENKAIQNALMQMQEEILEYQDKCTNSKKSMIEFKNEKEKKQLEKDKTIARTTIQLHVIKTLMTDRVKLFEKLKTFEPVVTENKNLLRKFQMVTQEVENKASMMAETKQSIEDKVEEANVMKEATSHLKKSTRRLQVLVRNALKIAEEAIAVRLIPMGKLEEEKYLTTDAKIRLFKKRRDAVFTKRGKILQYLFEFLSKGRLTEDDKKLLQASAESIGVEDINFSAIYGKAILMGEKEVEKKESEGESEEEKRKKGPMFFTSLTSLPRSLSALVIPEKPKSRAESMEGEFEEYEEEYGEEEEEEEEKEKGKEKEKEKEKEIEKEKEKEKEAAKVIKIEAGEGELFDDVELENEETDEGD